MCAVLNKQNKQTQPIDILPIINEKELELIGYTPIEHKISTEPATLELIEGALNTERKRGYKFILQTVYLGTIYLGCHNSETELEIIVFEAYRKNNDGTRIKFFNSGKLFIKKDDPQKRIKERLARGFCLLSAFFEARHIRCRETGESFTPVKFKKQSEVITARKLFSTFLLFILHTKRRIVYFFKK